MLSRKDKEDVKFFGTLLFLSLLIAGLFFGAYWAAAFFAERMNLLPHTVYS